VPRARCLGGRGHAKGRVEKGGRWAKAWPRRPRAPRLQRPQSRRPALAGDRGPWARARRTPGAPDGVMAPRAAGVTPRAPASVRERHGVPGPSRPALAGDLRAPPRCRPRAVCRPRRDGDHRSRAPGPPAPPRRSVPSCGSPGSPPTAPGAAQKRPRSPGLQALSRPLAAGGGRCPPAGGAPPHAASARAHNRRGARPLRPGSRGQSAGGGLGLRGVLRARPCHAGGAPRPLHPGGERAPAHPPRVVSL
jgi:hypothetical protein